MVIVTPKFARDSRLTAEPILYSLLHMMLILSSCIPRKTKCRKFVFPYFNPPKHHKTGVNRRLQANAQNIQTLYYQKDSSNFNQILHSYKDNQVLFVGCQNFAPEIQNAGLPPS